MENDVSNDVSNGATDLALGREPGRVLPEAQAPLKRGRGGAGAEQLRPEVRGAREQLLPFFPFFYSDATD